MYAIQLNNISKMYRIYTKPSHKLKEGLIRGIFRSQQRYHTEFWALKDLNLNIPKGVTLGIIGQNGSGKSTLLGVLTGILQPSKGSIQVEGRIAALLELGAGFNREFTGRENVFMNGAILGISQKELEDRFDQIAAFADIGPFMDQPVKTYSSGMYVRLAFATAVNVDPDILVIDEALSVGDAAFQRKCFKRMEEFQKAGKTIILVTHDMQTVRTFCNHAVLIDEGRIQEQGEPDYIVNSYYRLMASREETRLGKKRDARWDQIMHSHQAEGEKEFRYGTGKAELFDYALLDEEGYPTNILKSGKVFNIRTRVRFNQPVKHPRVGIIVKTLTGVAIYGTTTNIAGCPIGPVEAGTTITVDFEQVCRLNPGSYSLSLGVAEELETYDRPLDRRMDVMTFDVIGNKNFHGLVDNEVRVKIIEKGCVSESTIHRS